MNRLLDNYNKKITNNELFADKQQLEIISALNKLSNFLEKDELLTKKNKNLFSRIFKIKKQKTIELPKGFYFYGDVGRGKSMLMDLFFNSLTTTKKRRVHFHRFMLELHNFLHQERTSINKKSYNRDSSLEKFTSKLSSQIKILCFDEFHVKDVADAMILKHLFTSILTNGVTIIITSNIAPKDLYKGGLQYEYFLPFIELLEQKLKPYLFSGKQDYRFNNSEKKKYYFTPLNNKTKKKIDDLFQEIGGEGKIESFNIKVKGRDIFIPKAKNKIVEFTFKELFQKPKSALDYLELINVFKFFIVKNIPELNDKRQDAVKRFITFIDILYDEHAYIIISAENSIENLYKGTENKEEFKRTISRLTEMQSDDY